MGDELITRGIPAIPRGVEWSLRSANVTDPNLTLEDWEEALRVAGEFKRAMSFVIGDLILFGDGRYGERYAQAMEVTGLAYETLATYAYVCEHVRPSRRRPDLGFGHHHAVAPLAPDRQTYWLELAAAKRWTRVQLRDAIIAAGEREISFRNEKETEPLSPAEVVDAAADLVTARETLDRVGAAIASDEGRDAVGITDSLKALDNVGRTVKKSAVLRTRYAALRSAGREIQAKSVKQTGIADPAYITPAEPFEAFLAALEEAAE